MPGRTGWRATGADTLAGGPGADVFVFLSAADSTFGPAGRDRIVDFDPRQDRMGLAALDADAGRAGNQGFAFIGQAPFSGRAGQLHYEFRSDGTHVSGDLDGDRRPDFAIQLGGRITLGADDFLL